MAEEFSVVWIWAAEESHVELAPPAGDLPLILCRSAGEKHFMLVKAGLACLHWHFERGASLLLTRFFSIEAGLDGSWIKIILFLHSYFFGSLRFLSFLLIILTNILLFTISIIAKMKTSLHKFK